MISITACWLELGGSGTECPTRINVHGSLYGPRALYVPGRRVLAAANMDDGTRPRNLPFLERASASDSRAARRRRRRIGLGMKAMAIAV